VPKDGAVSVGLIGAGNVGAEVARTLITRSEEYARRLGRPVLVNRIVVRDAARLRTGIDPKLISTDVGTVLDDPAIDIVVDLTAGEQPALEYISRALSAGKYVVTVNKEVMAKHGQSFLALARQHNVDILFEGSVGGGIPIIAPLKRDLLGNRITAVSAIINGTTNYILTAMSRDGADFGDALAQAQELGYAEPDPTNDVEGEDARYKLAILASLAFRTPVRLDDIYREGITKLTAKDFRYAAELGYAIKLLALARWQDGGIQTRVHPTLLPADAPLAKVDGVLNAVQVEGDLVGRVNFQGRGAGPAPTTSAAVADVLEAARSIISGGVTAHGGAPMRQQEEVLARVIPMSELITRYYIRLTVADQPGVLAQIATKLGNAQISISSVIQKETHVDAQTAELVIMTHEAREASMQGALAELEQLDVVHAIGNFLRVEEQ
jgi:homoserine dehydrogenase